MIVDLKQLSGLYVAIFFSFKWFPYFKFMHTLLDFEMYR